MPFTIKALVPVGAKVALSRETEGAVIVPLPVSRLFVERAMPPWAMTKA